VDGGSKKRSSANPRTGGDSKSPPFLKMRRPRRSVGTRMIRIETEPRRSRDNGTPRLGSVAVEAEANERAEPPYRLNQAFLARTCGPIRRSSVSQRLTVVADADDEVGPIRSIASWKEWRALTACFSNSSSLFRAQSTQNLQMRQFAARLLGAMAIKPNTAARPLLSHQMDR
jgi:hypothetical protein